MNEQLPYSEVLRFQTVLLFPFFRTTPYHSYKCFDIAGKNTNIFLFYVNLVV